MVKNPPASARDSDSILGWEDPLEEDMTIHSGILAWRIPWAEEPGGLQSMGSQRVGHDYMTEHTPHLSNLMKASSKNKARKWLQTL